MRGFYDVLLECEMRDHAKMNTMSLPVADVWGAVARRDSDVGRLDGISPADLAGRNIVASRQALSGTLRDWAGDALDRMNVVATFNLLTNAKHLVRQGMCCMLTYEGLFDLGVDSDLRFVPFTPRFEAHQGLVWRASMPNKQTQVFLDAMEQVCKEHRR
ncbi:MAG: LysR substrate-binding domain-containing protein [Eggerthellaceae bacterium]